MNQITLTTDQASILEASKEPVAVRRPDGTVAGFLSPKMRIFAPDKSPFTPEEVEAALREAESCKQWFTTDQVLGPLREPS